MARYKDMEITRGNHVQDKSDRLTAAMLMVALALALFLATYGPAMAGEKPLATGDLTLFNQGTIAPDFSLQSLSGGRITLSELRGKIVLLDFWATW